MKKILILLALIILVDFAFSQDKLGFGNMPDGVDSTGFGTTTTWVKKASPPIIEGDSVNICGEWYYVVSFYGNLWLNRPLHCMDSNGGIYSYDNDTYISDIYGYLYTLDAAKRIDATISGWRLPTYDEIPHGIYYWLQGYPFINTCGGRGYDGIYYDLDLQKGYDWTSTAYNLNQTYCLTNECSLNVSTVGSPANAGYLSVLLIKD